MSNAKRSAKLENSPTEDVPPETIDPLVDYRKGMADLQSVVEKRTTLLSVQTDLEGQLARVEVDREAALSRATQTDELAEEEADELVRITTKAEVLRRKQTDVAKRLEAVEAELAASQSAVAARFSSLWHVFYQHAIGQARKALAEQLDGGIAAHILDLIARHHKSVQPIRELDIRTTDAQGVLGSAGRLLEAVSLQEGFIAPSYVSPTPAAPELDPLWTPGVPWSDRGVNVDEEIRQMHAQDPSLTLPRAMRLLYEKFPHIFTPPKEGNLSLNEPLQWKAPMIGSTTVSEPAEQEFSHAR